MFGQVVVADADRVRVAERALRGLGRRPHADAGDDPQPRQRRSSAQVGALLQPAGHGRRGADRPLPLEVDAEAGASPRSGCRAAPAPPAAPAARRAGRAPGAVPVQQGAPGPARLDAGDLLLEDGRHERLQHQAGRAAAAGPGRARSSSASTRYAARRPAPTSRRRSPSSAGTRSSSQSAPVAPRRRAHHARRARTARSVPSPSGVAHAHQNPAVVEPVGRVAGAAAQRLQRRAQVDRAPGVPLARAAQASPASISARMRVLESALSKPPTP